MTMVNSIITLNDNKRNHNNYLITFMIIVMTTVNIIITFMITVTIITYNIIFRSAAETRRSRQIQRPIRAQAVVLQK